MQLTVCESSDAKAKHLNYTEYDIWPLMQCRFARYCVVFLATDLLLAVLRVPTRRVEYVTHNHLFEGKVIFSIRYGPVLDQIIDFFFKQMRRYK